MTESNCGAMVEMPKYQCHKQVWALKIANVELRRDEEGAILTPEDKCYGEIHVGQDYVEKHNPEAGGYYVVYKDGYKSYSPAEAFEGGYIRVKVED